MNTKSAPLEERFWRFVKRGPEDACWLWAGCRGIHGYGSFNAANHGTIAAHRAAVMLLTNCPNPGPFFVLHSCDVPACVNPAHLRVGTQTENMKDREQRKRGNPAKGERHGKAKLSDEAVAGIRYLATKGYLQKDIAAFYRTPVSTVGCILTGRNRNKVQP